MPAEDFLRLKHFLEKRDAAVRAAAPLKDGAVFEMKISGNAGKFHCVREKGKTVLKEGEPSKNPDIIFTIGPKAIARLADFPSDNIGDYGVEFFKLMLSGDPDSTIKAKLNIGFFGLMRLGVFGVLSAGGPDVMSFLARRGLGSIKAIGSALKKLTGND